MRKIETTSCGTATIRFDTNGDPWVLLVKPRKEQEVWGFPKGHVEGDESHHEAAARETYEETGIRPVILPEVLGSARVSSGTERKTVHIYMAHPEGDELTPVALDGENHRVEWWPVVGLPEPHRYQRQMFDSLWSAVQRVFPSGNP